MVTVVTVLALAFLAIEKKVPLLAVVPMVAFPLLGIRVADNYLHWDFDFGDAVVNVAVKSVARTDYLVIRKT